MSQFIALEMQYATNTKMLYCIQSRFTVCKLACFRLFCRTAQDTSHRLSLRKLMGGTKGVLSVKSSVVFPNCMQIVSNTMCFVRLAAVQYVAYYKFKKKNMRKGTQPEDYFSGFLCVSHPVRASTPELPSPAVTGLKENPLQLDVLRCKGLLYCGGHLIS